MTNRAPQKIATDLWRTLRVGDKVRIVEVPADFSAEGYYLHRDTLRTYKRLIARGRALRVAFIDARGCPWVRCRLRRKDGRIEYHSLAINHSGLKKVAPRR